MSKLTLGLQRLREVLDYDPQTGVFRWRKKTCRKVVTGALAGATCGPKGYRRTYISIDGRRYIAARLAWFHVHGHWPNGHLDHCNRDPSDNRLANLREATPSQNSRNQGLTTRNTSGVKGACWDRQLRKWRAQIRVEGKTRHIGLFADKHEAGRAYYAEAQRLFGEFATAGGGLDK